MPKLRGADRGTEQKTYIAGSSTISVNIRSWEDIVGSVAWDGFRARMIKKTAAFSSEAEVIVESNPFHYKLPKEGWNAEVVFPFYLALSELMIKWSKNEKLADDDIKNIHELQEKMSHLIKGGFVGNPKKKFV